MHFKMRESEDEIGAEYSTDFALFRSRWFYLLYMWRRHDNEQWVSLRILGLKLRFSWGIY